MVIADIFGITLAFFAMIWDLRTYKIPNRFCLAGMLSGIVLNIILYGLRGVWISLSGVFYPIIMLWLFFLIRAVGAGDIKLLAAIGAFISRKIIYVMVAAFVIAAAYSLVVVILKLLRRLKKKTNVRYGFSRMHLSVPVFISCIFCFVYGMANV